MSIRTLLLPTVLALVISACSKSPAYEGVWKNREGDLITLRADSTALLGKEGFDGAEKAHWSVDGDTVRVLTDPQSDELGMVRNEYVLHESDDTLELARITLYRPGDTRSMTGAELAKRMGRPAGRLGFTRVASAEKGGGK